MTLNDSRSPESLHDHTIIENLLAEAGMNDPADAGLLKPALLSIRGLARGPQPAPSGELAALLTGLNTGTTAAPGSGSVSSLAAHRTRRHTRLAIAAAALTLSLGAGAAAAVASPDFRETIQKTVSTLIQTLAPSGRADRPGTPAPSSTPDSGVPAPAPPAPATAGSLKPGLPGQATPSPAFPPSARAETGESAPQPEHEPGINTPPDGQNPARPAPAQTAKPGTATAAPHQPDAVPVPSSPAPAPAFGDQPPPHPGRP